MMMMLQKRVAASCICAAARASRVQPVSVNTMTFARPASTFISNGNSNFFAQQQQQQHRFIKRNATASATTIGGEEAVDEQFFNNNEPIEAEVVESSSSTIKQQQQQQPQQQQQFERPNIFAVVQIGGKQYKVSKGDHITVEKIPVDIETQIKFQKVLLVGGKDYTAIGRPIIPGTFVTGTVCEQKRAAHIIVFKKKRRKGYRRTRGHRQLVTVVRIDDIQLASNVNASTAQEKVVAVE